MMNKFIRQIHNLLNRPTSSSEDLGLGTSSLGVIESSNSSNQYFAAIGPETVNIELTLRCNLKCKMCQRSDEHFYLPSTTDMPIQMVERVLPLLKDAKTIWLSGFGEPLMHPDLTAIIKKINRANPNAITAFTTNFILVTGKKLRELIEAGLKRIQVSIDGDNELGHALSPTSKGVARYRELLWKHLDEFYRTKQEMGIKNPDLQFCFVAMKRNVGQLEGIIKDGIKVGLSSIVVQPIRDYSGTLKGEDIFENRDYVLPLLSKAKSFAERNGVEFICRFMDEKMSVTRQKCNFPWTFFHVAVDGSVYMCCEGIAAGENISNVPPAEIWNSKAYQNLRYELATGRLRRKCWDCHLVKPTTDNESAIRSGMLELEKEKLIEEIITYRRYINAFHGEK